MHSERLGVTKRLISAGRRLDVELDDVMFECMVVGLFVLGLFTQLSVEMVEIVREDLGDRLL